MSKLRVLFMCASVSMVSTRTQAAEHEIQWAAAARAEHVDNVLLSTTNKEYLASAIFSPTLSYRQFNPTWNANLSASGTARRTSDPSFDRDEKHYKGSIGKSWQRTSLNMEVYRDESTVRLIELTENLEVSNDPVTTHSMQFNSAYRRSEADTLSASARIFERDYATDRYTDYSDWQIDVGWQHSLAEVLTLQTQLYHGEYAADRSDLIFATTPRTFSTSNNRSETLGVQAGLIGQLNEKTSYNLLAGASDVTLVRDSFFFLENNTQTRFRTDYTSREETNSVFAATLNYQGERQQWSVNSNKQLQASGSGFQYDTVSAGFNLSYRLAQFWTLHSAVTYSSQKTLGAIQRLDLDRKSAIANVGISKRIGTSLTFSATINYAGQRYESSKDTAEALSGSVQFRYSPDPIRF